MTDISKPTTQDLSTVAARRGALIKKRYASETRFKLIGLCAIMVSIAFLVLLLSTFVREGLPAFTYHYAKLQVDLSKVDPEKPEAADYGVIVKKGIAEAMPYLSGRKGRRLARNMVSGASNIVLRRAVLEDVGLIGGKQEFAVPVSDFADLYLKGLTAQSITENPPVALKVSGVEGTVDITLEEAAFGSFLATAKETIARSAERIHIRLTRLQLSLDQQLEISESATDPQTVQAAKSNAENLGQQIATLKQKRDALIARRDNAAGGEMLDASMPSLLLKVGGGTIKVTQVDAVSAKGEVLLPLSEAGAAAGEWEMKTIVSAEENRKFSDKEVAVMDRLVEDGLIENRWNSIFFTNGASREPEMAGVWGAVVGSFFTMIITFLLSFPLGVAAAIYLEEFAPKNRLTDFIEVNINNLAAVPSIVFGLLGLAVFLNFFEMPRSAPVVGGVVLALMTLPVIIIAARTALKAVPPSIREAALGVGASKLQAVFHHVLPLALPGILTGAIIGMARALGETAPLLMIGMVAFVVDIPGGFTDPATVLPVQIYMWADFPEPGFQQKTAAAIIVLLAFLVIMNAVAVLLRKRFERRW